MRTRLSIIGISLLFAVLTLIPYAVAAGNAGDLRFTGFLFNPSDAASYLAKMRQGYDGQILYSLAFTDNPGPGALIFSFYLALGRLARFFHMPLIYMWQIARMLGAAFFLTIAWEFYGRVGFSMRGRALAWILTLLGSGLGFFAVLFGTFTADLWVAEYIPFLGMLTNAHFPLATGLMLLLTMQIALPARRQTPASLTIVFLLGAALGGIQPFGFLPVGLALTVWILWMRWSQGRFPEGAVAGMIAAGFGFLPWVLYDLWIIQTLPSFASWFAQNQTPTPPVWDLALSIGLPGLIAAVSLLRWLKIPAPPREKLRSIPSGTLLLGLWLAINLVLLYAPFSLQRRLMLGMWIPLAGIAAPMIEAWVYRPGFSFRRACVLGAPLVLTNLVFLAVILLAGISHNPRLFLSRDEAAAVDWLNTHAHGSVVLAAPQTSLWLPGLAGTRVVYGHPMETPDAERALQEVNSFFTSADADTQIKILADHQVDWIICSTDQPVCIPSAAGLFQEVFTSGNVKILAVDQE